MIDLNKYDDLVFDDALHKYTIKNKIVELTSVTTIIDKYKNKFDSLKHAKNTSEEYNIPLNDVLANWDYKSKLGADKGTISHCYMESKLSNKTVEIPKVIPESYEEFMKLKPAMDNFLKKYKNVLKPVSSEFRIYDEEYKIAGTIDQIFYDEKTNKYYIFDWKTNKEIKTTGYCKLKDDLGHLDECEYILYSLQLGLYKHILEKHGAEINSCFICWFGKDGKYKVIETLELKEEINMIISSHINKI